MSNKKRRLSVDISALVSTVNSVQNGLGDFEKSSGFKDFFKDIYGDKIVEIEKL